MGRCISEAERLGRRCSNCGERGSIVAKGLCGACYAWVKDHGTPRPANEPLGLRKPLLPCSNCGRPFKPLTRGLCRRCYARWHNSGRVDRPRKVAAQPPIPPAPEDLFFLSLEQGIPRYWPGRGVTGPPGPRSAEALRLVEEAGLTERERYVVIHTFGLDGGGRRALTLVAPVLGVTRERIRQLQHAGIKKLQRLYAGEVDPQDTSPAPEEAPSDETGPGAGAALEALARALRAERALVGGSGRGEDEARTWEAGMLRGLRIGKQAAYDVALSLIDDVQAGKEITR